VIAVHSAIRKDQKNRGIKGHVSIAGAAEPIAVTDSTWRCSPTTDDYAAFEGYSHVDWTKAGYSDFSWDKATFNNGVLNAPNQDPAHDNAKWIWSLNNQHKDTMFTSDKTTQANYNKADNVDKTNSTSAFCRISFSVAVDSVTPDEAMFNGGDTVTIHGRGFGRDGTMSSYNQDARYLTKEIDLDGKSIPDDELPTVSFAVDGRQLPCSNLKRISERKLTCNVPKLGPRSGGTQKEAHVEVQRLNEECNEYNDHSMAQELPANDVALDGIRESYRTEVPFTFKCSCSPALSGQPPNEGYKECSPTTCSKL